MKYLFLLFFLLAPLTQDIARDKAYFEFIGLSVQDLYNDWGSPDRVPENNMLYYVGSSGRWYIFMVSQGIIYKTLRTLSGVSKDAAYADRRNGEQALIDHGFYFAYSADGVNTYKRHDGKIGHASYSYNYSSYRYDCKIVVVNE